MYNIIKNLIKNENLIYAGDTIIIPGAINSESEEVLPVKEKFENEVETNNNVIENSKNDSTDKLDLVKSPEQVEAPTPHIFDENEEGELLDLQAITKALEENKTLNVDLTEYEKEQEERAIISYEELLAKTNNTKINYEEEEIINDIQIKKVDLANLVNEAEEVPEPKISVQVISYEREEAFLTALKQLQQNLN